MPEELLFKDQQVDTSGDAVKEPEVPAAPVEAPPAENPVEPPKEEPAAPPAEAAKPTEPPKMLAGKYKSVEELEKGYLESQKGFHSAVEKEVAKRLEEEKTKAATVAADNKTASEVVLPKEEPLTAEKEWELMTTNPLAWRDKVKNDVKQEVLQAIQVQETLNTWRRDNSDLLNYERFVNTELLAIAKERPELISNHAALLSEATGRVRNIIADIRNQGKQEALTVKETVTPLNVTATTPATPDSAVKPPEVDPVDEAVAMQQRYTEERKRPRIYGAR